MKRLLIPALLLLTTDLSQHQRDLLTALYQLGSTPLSASEFSDPEVKALLESEYAKREGAHHWGITQKGTSIFEDVVGSSR